MIQPNPQSEQEIMDSFTEAREYPTIFTMKRESELYTLLRRWSYLGKFEGESETFYHMVEQHIEMALTAMRLLRREREKQ